MSTNHQPQRPRGPPEGISTESFEARNGKIGGGVVPGTLSRAEKFEDEKRRIIDSCFGRTDADGSGNLIISIPRFLN